MPRHIIGPLASAPRIAHSPSHEDIMAIYMPAGGSPTSQGPGLEPPTSAPTSTLTRIVQIVVLLAVLFAIKTVTGNVPATHVLVEYHK